MKRENKKIDFENNYIRDGFIPDQLYLAELESSLFEKLDIEETFESKDDGFDQDSFYLESLEQNILKAVAHEQEETKVDKVITLMPYRKLWIAAASVAAIITLIITVPKVSLSPDAKFADLTQESEEWYLNQRALFLTDDDLSLLLKDEVFDMEIEDEALQKELENYILENEHFLYGIK